MPLYEYHCGSCRAEFELIRKFNETDLEVCPHCGQAQVSRKTSRPSFHLKGGGWYKDSYSSNPSPAPQPKAAVSESKANSSAAKDKTPKAKPKTTATANNR